jgi:glutamate formiminotransferase/formiminotetrahydrofolate cyclodeaminase
MAAILECVPNISEGQRPEVLAVLATAIQSVPGVQLLHQDTGYSAHRTVFTFAGEPEGVVEAAFQLIKAAAEQIDMRQHRGIHPRMGATDVCPLVPISGISLEDTVRLSRQLGQRVGKELGIPVYLYEASATAPHRRNLAAIRKGEYEGFREKILQPEWKPDFGPQTFQPKSGQTVIGAREFLVAYNVNLASDSVALAKEIAAEIRESGRWVEQAGKKVRIPGRCQSLKAIGWWVEEFGEVQVSMNLTRLADTNLHQAYEAVQQAAAVRGVKISGSELIGMIPLQAMIEAGIYFLTKSGQVSSASESELISLATAELGLGKIVPFDPMKKILEYRMKS